MATINKYASASCPLFGKGKGQAGVAPVERYDMFAPVVVGEDGSGHDVTFHGATAGANVMWDESADELVFAAGASLDITAEVVMIDFKAGDASSIDPSATAESGWVNIAVDGTKRYVPFYAAS